MSLTRQLAIWLQGGFMFYVLSHGLLDLSKRSEQIPKKHKGRMALKSGWRVLGRYRDCDEEWQLLSENGFVDLFFLILCYGLTQKLVSFGSKEVFKFGIEKYAKFMVNLAFLSSIYGYAALMFTGILASFVYITGKMVKNCSILMLILSSIVILIHTFNDIILVVMSHGKHFEFYTGLTQLAIILSLFRAMSFVFEDTINSLENYFDFIEYIFYAPTFSYGPVVTFDAYQESQRNDLFTFSSFVDGIKSIVLNFICLIGVDFILHYVYLHSMFAHGDSSGSVLTGLLILTILAVYEWLKIYLLYQLVSSVACFEGRSFGELAPKALYRVYFFADTSFDRSLQFWVDKYCFQPWSNGGWLSEGFGIIITYFFVWISQGFSYPIAICLGLNWFGLQQESFFIKYVRPCMSSFLYRALVGSALGFNFLLFVVFNSIAVIGLDAATNFVMRLIEQDVWALGIVLLVSTVYGNLNYMLDEPITDITKKNQ